MCVYAASLRNRYVHTCWIEHSDSVVFQVPRKTHPSLLQNHWEEQLHQLLTGISLLVNKEQINAFTNLAHHAAIIYVVFKVRTHELIPDAWVSYVKPSCYNCSLL